MLCPAELGALGMARIGTMGGTLILCLDGRPASMVQALINAAVNGQGGCPGRADDRGLGRVLADQPSSLHGRT